VAFSIPATYAAAFGFMYGYGKILESMAQSNLYPHQLKYTFGPNKTPIVAIITGSVIGMGICILAFIYPVINQYIFNMCLLFATMTYMAQCVSYVKLVSHYKNKINCQFESPFGIYGAIYAATVFMVIAICVIGLQSSHVPFYVCIVVIGLLTCYYYKYVGSHQILNDDETKLIFTKLVIYRNRIAIRHSRAITNYEYIMNCFLLKSNKRGKKSSRSNISSTLARLPTKKILMEMSRKSQIHPLENEIQEQQGSSKTELRSPEHG
jgi:amino acid permease